MTSRGRCCGDRLGKRVTGERKLWFRLASHLGKSLQEVQDQTTSTEFVQWNRYLDDDVNAFHREDHYMAQIAAEVRRGHDKHPEKVMITDHILEFERVKDAAEEAEEFDVKHSKDFWYAALGIKKEDQHGV